MPLPAYYLFQLTFESQLGKITPSTIGASVSNCPATLEKSEYIAGLRVSQAAEQFAGSLQTLTIS